MNKGLEALYLIKGIPLYLCHYSPELGVRPKLVDISTFLDTIEIVLKNQDKILKIIKEKKVNLEYIRYCETYKEYKTRWIYWNEITQQEFDLLKEWLEQ